MGFTHNRQEAINKGAGLIHNAYSMDTRFKVIEEVGGIFYKDPKHCPYLDLPLTLKPRTRADATISDAIILVMQQSFEPALAR